MAKSNNTVEPWDCPSFELFHLWRKHKKWALGVSTWKELRTVSGTQQAPNTWHGMLGGTWLACVPRAQLRRVKTLSHLSQMSDLGKWPNLWVLLLHKMEVILTWCIPKGHGKASLTSSWVRFLEEKLVPPNLSRSLWGGCERVWLQGASPKILSSLISLRKHDWSIMESLEQFGKTWLCWAELERRYRE